MAFGRRHNGQVVEWNDEKGYGFIRDGDGARLFFHATDVQAGNPRPVLGDLVAFGVAPGRDGRPSARPVRIDRARSGHDLPVRKGAPRPGLGNVGRLVAAVALAGAALAGSSEGQLPGWLPYAYLGMGAVSIALYRADKSAARKNAWRIPESTLHAADLFGGIVGGLVAQSLLRHKTLKPSFIAATAGIVLLHAAAIIVVLLEYPLVPV